MKKKYFVSPSDKKDWIDFTKHIGDIRAKEVIQYVFPDRKIITINGIDISMGGGNVHCITQQQPMSL